MPNRFAGAMAGAVALTLAMSGIALADSVDADADVVVSGTQSLINLGTVAAGSTHEVDFGFDLVCKGLSHVPVGQLGHPHADGDRRRRAARSGRPSPSSGRSRPPGRPRARPAWTTRCSPRRHVPT